MNEGTDTINIFGINRRGKRNLNNIENNIKNFKETILKKISEIFKEVDNNENVLSKKVLKIYKNLSKENKDIDKNFIELIYFIYSEAKECKKNNLAERLNNFFDFFISSDIKYECLESIFNINNKNSDVSDKDIVYFWKKQISKEYIKRINDEIPKKEDICFLESEAFEKLFKLLENNSKYNLNQIYQVFIYFNKIKDKEELFNSLLSTVKSYPGIDLSKHSDIFDNNINEENKMNFEEKEKMNEINDKNITEVKNKNEYEDDKENNNRKEDESSEEKEKKENIIDNQTALNFYLKISKKDASIDKKIEEETEENEFYEEIKELNKDLKVEKINKIKNQIKQIKEVIKEKNFELDEQFQYWAENECSQMKFGENIDSDIAEVLGVISLAVYKEFNYHLRNAQLIAILMFLYKEKNKGLIEEIVTGEGKSIIIASLSIYFALRKKYVDIITSGYTLAQRDSKKYSKLYGLFNLTTSYPRNYSPVPYEANILYGTFLEFEGDNLSELTSDKKIRNKIPRPYQVLIVDEVDNLFIDNILGSTRLTNSSRGFKFLVPYYFTTYLSVLLISFSFKMKSKIRLNSYKDEKLKQKLIEYIEDPKTIKKEIEEIINKLMEEIKNKNPENKNQDIKIDENAKKIIKDIPNFYEKIIKYIDYPNFLKDFVNIEEKDWISSAIYAQTEMFLDQDYVKANDRHGFKDIAPVDRTNTGEIELSTVYDEGLHQMLEIKELLRIREETVVHTFLSHITYFKKYYKKNEEFLFFGMSGTLGYKDALDIYNNQYFSNVMFIPPYKKKRFVILPTILGKNEEEHLQNIYENIRLNYLKKRKILVICDSIMEAETIKNKICDEAKKNANNIFDNNKNFNIGDIESDIVLYTRSDKMKEDDLEKNINKKIFLSTNLGGRGTDLKTNQEEENNGGLHVILTSMPKNYRVLKQAFGRTSREGKKGTGQLIIYNNEYKTYSEIVNIINENEKERIEKIQKQLDILLFKDDLFERFIGLLRTKKIDYKGFLIDEIKYRWANFLKKNVTSNKGKLNKDKIIEEFGNFTVKIEKILEEKNNIDNIFENKFYQMAEGIRNNRNYKGNIMDYFMFTVDEKNEKFYFAQTYIKAIIRIVNAKNTEYNDLFFKDILGNLDKTINRIELLINEYIHPILYSFSEWEQFTKNLIKFGEKEKIKEKNPFEIIFERTDLYRQYSNIRNICMRIIQHIKLNRLFIINYSQNYRNNPDYSIFVIERLLEDGLSLNENEIKEKYFFIDSSFNYVYSFILKEKENRRNEPNWWDKFKMFLKFIQNFIAKSFISIINKFFNSNFQIIEDDNIELSHDTIFSSLFDIIKRKLNLITGNTEENDNEEDDNIEIVDENDHDLSNIKDLLLSDILKNIDVKFHEKLSQIEYINFLIFVDFYLDEETWKNIIRKIFDDNLIQYRQKIEEIQIKKEDFSKNVRDERYKIYLEKYNQIFNSYLEKCFNELKHLLDKKEYDRKTGLNCLEHLIKNLNPEEISENNANKTVKKLIEYNFISKKGILNKNFLKNNQKQYIKINININYNNKNIDNNRMNNFYIDNINNNEIPKVNALFYDLVEIYEKENYFNLSKDYSFYIKNNFKNIADKILDFTDKEARKFFELVINFVKVEVENLLRKNNFRKCYEKSMRNLIKLSNKEEKILSEIMDGAKEDVLKQFKEN